MSDFRCPECGALFGSKVALDQHLHNHHQEGGEMTADQSMMADERDNMDRSAMNGDGMQRDRDDLRTSDDGSAGVYDTRS